VPYSLKALQTFESAARLGSFKAAANELSVTTTAVSHQIRALESQLGLKLFKRHVRAISLTPTGEFLSSRISPGFRMIDGALQELSSIEARLCVTTTPAFAANWLAPRQAAFGRTFAGIRLSVETGHEPIDLDRHRDIGLAIRYSNRCPHADASLLARERFAVFGTPSYIASLKSPADALFAITDWQRPVHPAADLGTWLDIAGVEADPANLRVSRFDQEHHAISLALSGQALAFCSNLLVSHLVRDSLLEPYLPNASIEGLAYWTIVNPASLRPRVAERFRDWISEQV
jgi:LysR family transcriptional regulator, glycine cleavage system transcriptional activator